MNTYYALTTLLTLTFVVRCVVLEAKLRREREETKFLRGSLHKALAGSTGATGAVRAHGPPGATGAAGPWVGPSGADE